MDNQSFGFNEGENFETPGVNASPTRYVTYIPYGFTPETYEEKKGIKKAALIIGLSLLCLMGIMFFWATALFFVATKLGFNIADVQKFISDPAILQVVQVLLSSLMFTVPFIIIYKLNGMRISDLVPLSPPKKGNRLAIFFLGLSFCAFANIVSSYAGYFFKSFGIDYSVDKGENPAGFFGFLLSFIATAVVPGLVEEFACRGLILGSLRKYGDGFAVLVSSILFGFMHGNFEQMPFAFMVGLILGFIVVKTNSLWIAVAVHSANNFISVVFDYILSGLKNSTQNLIYSIYLMIALLLGVIFIAIKGDKDLLSFEKSSTASSFKQKSRWFFSSAAIIIFLIVCVLESLMYF